MLKKIFVAFILGFYFLYGMGLLAPIPLNNSDPIHSQYEIVPLKIDGERINGKIFALPEKNILLFSTKTKVVDKRKKLLETQYIYNISDKTKIIVIKNKELKLGPRNGRLVYNKKLILLNAYAPYRDTNNKLISPKGGSIDILNLQNIKTEKSISTSKNYYFMGMLSEKNLLLESKDRFYTFNIFTGKINPYLIEIQRDKTTRINWPLLYQDTMYLQVHDNETKEIETAYKQKRYAAIKDRNQTLENKLSKSFLKVFKYTPKDDSFNELMTIKHQWGAKEIMITEDKMLMVGGFLGATSFTPRAEVVDFKKKTQTLLDARLNIPRDIDNLVLLDDGNVLIMHGDGNHQTGQLNALDSVELFVTSENRFVLFKTKHKRAGSQFVKLSDGDILIYDGVDGTEKRGDRYNSPPQFEAEIFRRKR